MSFVSIEAIGSESLERVNKILSATPRGIWKATHAALKRSGDAAKTKAGQFAAAEYTIRKADFMRNVRMKSQVDGGSNGILSMKILYAGTVLPLKIFQTKISRRGLVQTKVARASSVATLQHAFTADVFGAASIFERVGTGRFPIEQKYGPSTGHMMQNQEVIKKMDESIRTTYEKRIDHEIMRVLNGWGN